MASSIIMRNFKYEMFRGNIDLDSDTFYVALLSGTNSLNASVFETMINFSAAQVYETNGTGYTAGGLPLTASPISLNGSNAVWDSADITWPNSTINADGLVIYKLVTNANDSPLVLFMDLYNVSPVGYKSSNNGDFILQWNSLGILNGIS
jgi:hypothetical protein